ncbi:hypothetical protein [Borrelia crocidurae]|uniref:hypothetical protein n=1 Tax=Borrelia crocidurae TaxID=29520 RepID=UPI0002E47C17|nr:hypothetical protein [Borrelia crocidurae]
MNFSLIIYDFVFFKIDILIKLKQNLLKIGRNSEFMISFYKETFYESNWYIGRF